MTKPGQKRRLAAEKAVYNKFNNFRECADACNSLALKRKSDVSFNRLAIQQYVGCQTNLSFKRLVILAELLGVTDYIELNEIFTAPKHVNEGDWWIGDNGNKIKDFDATMMNQMSR